MMTDHDAPPAATDEPTPEQLERLGARVGVLVRRFRQIAEGMRDLPLYNPAIVVEAVDFQMLGRDGVGVLVTPWFMNVILLAPEPEVFSMGAMGRKSRVMLPAGPRDFLTGGDEVTGLYRALSLHSPLFDFASHDAAVAAARRHLAELLTAPVEEDAPGPTSSRTTLYEQRPAASGGSRRDFLLGRRGA